MFETPTSFDLDIKTLNYVNKSDNENPKYACVGDSGFDLRAWITKEEKDVKIDKDFSEQLKRPRLSSAFYTRKSARSPTY